MFGLSNPYFYLIVKSPIYPSEFWILQIYFILANSVIKALIISFSFIESGVLDECKSCLLYTSDRWKQLAADVAKYGIRNGYLMAVAPTGSTSNIANTTAGIDPIFKKFFIEEKKGSFTPKTAPDLNDKTFWLYKEAHTIDQQWSIKACGVRQRHIDQAQSFNLYITPQMKAKEILDLYVEAYKQGIKTIYYIRNQSLEMDECTSCSS